MRANNVHVISDDKAQLLAVTAFNYYPNRYIHPSWVERLENGKIIGKLLRNARSEDNLAEYLLERFELKEKLWFEFDTPLRQLLLQPRDDILRIVLHAGAVLNGAHVRHAIHRQDVLRLRQGFGDRLFEFALNEAPLMFNVKALPKIAGPRPGSDLRAHLVASGLWCLGRALEGEPAAIVERLYLKMSAAEYPFLAEQPASFRKAPCVTVIEKLTKMKLAL